MKRISYLLALVLTVAFIGDVEARRGGGGGFSRSSSSSSRSSWGSSSSKSSPSKSSWGKSSTSKTTANRSATKPVNKTMHPAPKRTTTKKIVPKKPISATDKKRIASAKSSGKYYKDKKSATEAFKKQNAGKYQSKYTTKPATRPTHIPQTYSAGGRSYNVTFNSTHGGYGYMGPLGTWIMYDMYADEMMRQRMMRQSGYVIESNYYDTRTVRQPVVVVERRSSGCSMGVGTTVSMLPLLLMMAGIGITRFRTRK